MAQVDIYVRENKYGFNKVTLNFEEASDLVEIREQAIEWTNDATFWEEAIVNAVARK